MIIGVLGTMVWDRIEHPDGEVVERWGGITYSLAAAAAATPADWTIRPIIRLGRDLADEGWAFLESVPGLDRPGGVVEVDEPNNRVRLDYRDRQHRDEYLTGGVSGWSWEALKPHLEGLDGLYVNMISGFELDHRTAGALGEAGTGLRYVDLHSLVLDVGEHGRRVPRPPAHRDAWLRAFDVVQANERELEIVAGSESPDAVAAAAVRDGTRAILVTRGPRGATWYARDDAPLRGRESVDPDSAPDDGAVRSGEVVLPGDAWRGDPTGCGDVWGATCFARLMTGARLTDAMAAANRAAARNVDHRGADGLYEHLRVEP